MATLHVGGLERMVHTLSVGGRELGLDSSVYAYSEEGDFRLALEADGVPVHFFGGKRGLRRDLASKLAWQLRLDEIDVLHTHHVGPFIYGGIAAKLAGVPHVHTEHSRELYDRPRMRLVGRAMAYASTVICVSNELADYRAKTFGDDAQVIVNGVGIPTLDAGARRAAARAAIGLDPDALAIVCVARFMPEKDHATLVDAFARVAPAHPNARLVLIGWGPTREDVVRRASEAGVSDRLLSLGMRDDVEELLPAGDLITLSSVREGLPLALLEGMAAGLPAVATDVGEIRPLLADGCGAVSPARDVDAFAANLDAYLRDPARRAREGTAARERVVGSYSGEAMIRAYGAVYRRVAQEAAS